MHVPSPNKESVDSQIFVQLQVKTGSVSNRSKCSKRKSASPKKRGSVNKAVEEVNEDAAKQRKKMDKFQAYCIGTAQKRIDRMKKHITASRDIRMRNKLDGPKNEPIEYVTTLNNDIMPDLSVHQNPLQIDTV